MNDVGKIQADIKDPEHGLLDPDYVMEKLIVLIEDKSHWNNLQIDGVKEASET